MVCHPLVLPPPPPVGRCSVKLTGGPSWPVNCRQTRRARALRPRRLPFAHRPQDRTMLRVWRTIISARIRCCSLPRAAARDCPTRQVDLVWTSMAISHSPLVPRSLHREQDRVLPRFVSSILLYFYSVKLLTVCLKHFWLCSDWRILVFSRLIPTTLTELVLYSLSDLLIPFPPLVLIFSITMSSPLRCTCVGVCGLVGR
ncbi:hypothetical protein DL93DRAFT_177549 [Clavulina sp. PMI_390]|nr:hypothetical protein DL93DRAFT_177549 [Clavulina sp. PMI_390]